MSESTCHVSVAADEETDIIMGLDMGVMIILQSPLSWLYFYQELTHFFMSENFQYAAAEISSNGIHIQLLKRNGI